MKKKHITLFILLIIFLYLFSSYFDSSSSILSSQDQEYKIKTYQRNYVPRPQDVLISILTAPRPVGYLNTTLERIINEIKFIPSSIATINVLVANPRPGEHELFSDVKRQSHLYNYPISFKDVFSVKAPENESFKGKWRDVLPRDIQLSNDLYEYLKVAQSQCIDWILLLEDDFLWCSGFWAHFVRVMSGVQEGLRVGRLKSLPSMIRISFGLNGVLLPCSDIHRILQFIQDHKREGAIDSLLGEFWSKTVPDGQKYFNSRLPLVYRYNLMKHIGNVSTRKFVHTSFYPDCYDFLVTTSLMDGENFDPITCKNEDFSPCSWMSFEEKTSGQKLVKSNHIDVPKNILKLGKPGESCDEACNERKCAEWLFPLVNNCEVLIENVKCEGNCRVNGIVHLEPMGPSKLETVCSISSLHPLKCESKSNNVERLCPCI